MASTEQPSSIAPARAHGMNEEVEAGPNQAEHLSSNREKLLPFTVPPSDGSFDPLSSDFDPPSWARSFQRSRLELNGGKPLNIGLVFRDLDVYGFGNATDFQSSVGSFPLEVLGKLQSLFGRRKPQRQDILRSAEGVLYPGEMLAVLGPPGSGCSTFLKTLAGDTYGFNVADHATLNYHGISRSEMWNTLKGETVYVAEDDHHLPHLTVGDALYFAARTRNLKPPPGTSRRQYAEHLRDVIMNLLRISHTKRTKVGDDLIRGVSGGERKRVSIAEVLLGWAPLQSWDNSTRGLDSASAVQFCKVLRLQADTLGITSSVAIYQAPEEAYQQFDKVILLYEGRQIFFGPSQDAKAYFEELGFLCPEQQTTADFLTSMTRSEERLIKPGFEDKVPQTSDDFAAAWKASSHRQRLVADIDEYEARYPNRGDQKSAAADGGPQSHSALRQYLQSRQSFQSSGARLTSRYLLSYLDQLQLLLWRSAVLLRHDPSLPVTMLSCNTVVALVVASVFYNLQPETSSLYPRSMVLFLALIVNALSGIMEIFTLYAKRKTVDKQARYALYMPSAEAAASFIVDFPYKITNLVVFNLILYFMTNLRREPGAFFFYLLISFATMLALSMTFRLQASLTRSVEQCLAPSAIILLSVMIFCGFAIPPRYLDGWIGWQRWTSPLYYAMESLMLNEFVGRRFSCSDFVPRMTLSSYDDVPLGGRTCEIEGAVPGEATVDGAAYLRAIYGFDNSNRWRNFGIILAMTVGVGILHLIATEYIVSERSKGEVLVFTYEDMRRKQKKAADVEALPATQVPPKKRNSTSAQWNSGSETEGPSTVFKPMSVFHWKNVCYDVDANGQRKRLLDHVDGWVKPGTLTALMGASGAGKTTLLDTLASRKATGIVSGDVFVNGMARDLSFQRKTGYAQQQDLHQPTSTVREALNFSAVLRQPAHYTKKEKLAYVDEVIGLLGMEEYSEAVIGEPGEGLNVEQRKRLTVGVELAARPELLVFLDEPTSGLDSQTSQSICDLLETLTRNGQAILCTVHQPSATLFQRFDRLLLLAKGGRTAYFGEIGAGSRVLLDYFTRNGGPIYTLGTNPAEYMLEAMQQPPRECGDLDWHDVWRESAEYEAVQKELAWLERSSAAAVGQNEAPAQDPSSHNDFAASFPTQFAQVFKREFKHYWRSPRYIFARSVLSFGSALFIGLSNIHGDNSMRGVYNHLMAVFFFLFIFSQVVEQMLPVYTSQRSLYEAREMPSKTYSWQVFLAANVLVEMAWNSLMAVLCYVCWYYPLGFYRNADYSEDMHARGIALFLIIWVFFIFTTSFAYIIIAGLETAEVAGAIVILAVVVMFVFCGVLDFPGFWIFMHRVSPFTYVVEALMGISLAGAPVRCASHEMLEVPTPSAAGCDEFLQAHIEAYGGYLGGGGNGEGDGSCQYCPMADTDDYLSSIDVDFANRWRNFGILWAYCIFNIALATSVHWLVRVPKGTKGKAREKEKGKQVS